MRKALVGVFLVGTWAAIPATWTSAQQPDCEAARCSLQSSINDCCSNAKNHGQPPYGNAYGQGSSFADGR